MTVFESLWGVSTELGCAIREDLLFPKSTYMQCNNCSGNKLVQGPAECLVRLSTRSLRTHFPFSIIPYGRSACAHFEQRSGCFEVIGRSVIISIDTMEWYHVRKLDLITIYNRTQWNPLYSDNGVAKQTQSLYSRRIFNLSFAIKESEEI